MIDLFSGIGGFSLAAQWCWGDDLEIEAFVEIDPFCKKVLAKNFPRVPCYDDIKKIQWVVADSESVGRRNGTPENERMSTGDVNSPCNRISISQIDILTGGFPCQPFSCAGKRAGTEDDRFIWLEMLRTIHEVKPRWVVAENVPGLLTLQDGMVFEGVCADLEAEGYEVQPVIVPACAQGAPHRRDRVWIIGHALHSKGNVIGSGLCEIGKGRDWRKRPDHSNCHAPDTDGFHGDDAGYGSGKVSQFKATEVQGCGSTHSIGPGLEIGKVFRRDLRPKCKAPVGNPWQEHWYAAASRLCGISHGLPRGVDRVNRLKALGNSIVPQIALAIFKAISEKKGMPDAP